MYGNNFSTVYVDTEPHAQYMVLNYCGTCAHYNDGNCDGLDVPCETDEDIEACDGYAEKENN